MKLRKKTEAAMIMALLCATLASGCGQTKIGYIDGERVSKEAPQINSLIEEGNQKIEEAQAQASQELQKLAAVSKNKKLDAVVNNSTDQPVAVTGAVDVTDDVIAQLQ